MAKNSRVLGTLVLAAAAAAVGYAAYESGRASGIQEAQNTRGGTPHHPGEGRYPRSVTDEVGEEPQRAVEVE